MSCTKTSIGVPVAASDFPMDSVEGQRWRPSELIRLEMLKVVGSSPAFLAKPEVERPALRGQPVIVGAPPSRRGVVAAASYEARKFGVRSAMPSTTAKRLCPELLFVKPRFDVYKEVSRQIRDIFLDYTPLVEPLSLDEAYLDVTANLKGMPLASDIAREIRARIFAETGLTASAGISYNKFLAKLASDHRKPNGQTVITPEKGPPFLEGLPVGKFHGVGPKTAEKMNRLGIHTGADLKASNTFEKPTLVAPRALEAPSVASTMTFKLPARSYSVAHIATS